VKLPGDLGDASVVKKNLLGGATLGGKIVTFLRHNRLQRINESFLLPFKSTLFKGFYDGPLDGLTTCEICKQGFFYREIEYINSSFRVYRFTKVPINHYEFAKKFNTEISQGAHIDFPDDEKAELLYSAFDRLSFTHICVMGWYLSNALLWRKVRSDDLIVTNWEEYLGIIFDPEAEEYNLLDKGKGWAI